MQYLQKIPFRLFGWVFGLVLSSTLNLSAQKNLLTLIPAEAIYVATLQGDDINAKMPWEELAKYEFVEELARNISGKLRVEDQNTVREAILNPSNYGIDLKSTGYGFAEIRSDGNSFVSCVFRINDPKKFKSLLDGYFGNKINTLMQQQGNYFVISKQKIAIAWQKDHAIVTFAQVARNYYYDESEDEHLQRAKTELESYFTNILTLSEDNSYAANTKFIEWEKTVRDAGSWLNYQDIMRLINENIHDGGYGGMTAQLLPLIMEMYGEMNIGSDISFEKGAIYSDNLIYVEPDIMELAAKMANQKANKKFIQYLDGENLVGYVSMSMSPKGMYEGWKELLMKKAGPIGADVVKDLFGIWEIFMDEKASFNFLKGDLLMAFNGMKMEKTMVTDYVYNPDTDNYDPVEQEIERPIPLFMVAFSYGKKEDMMKFIRIFSTLGLLREGKGGTYEGGGSNSLEKFYVKLDKGLMLISNDADRLLNGKKYKALDNIHKTHISQNMQTAYFSVERMINAIAATEAKVTPADEEAMKEIKNMFGDFFLITPRPKSGDKVMRQEFVLELKNKETNALKVFLDFVNAQYLKTMKGT